jgi:hypothetical protein
MKINKQDLLNIKTLIEKKSITERKFKNQEIVSLLKLNASVKSSRRGSIKYIELNKEENIFLFLQNYNYNISSLEQIDAYIEDMFSKNVPRDIIQKYNNNTKAKISKSLHGLYVSSLEKLDIILNSENISILPNDGLGYFFFASQKVELFEDTVVVGVENYQVVWFAKRYANFFKQENVLFVVTTPYMLEWISDLENEYIHFGDFDLAGVNIYLNKVVPRLLKSKKYSMFIPSNIEELIEKHGNTQLYESQKQYKDLHSKSDEVNDLIKIINKFKKGFEQEVLSYK